MKKIREKQVLPNILMLLTMISSFWGLGWFFVVGRFPNISYFSNQAVLFVFVTVIAYYMSFDERKWFKYLASITLMNIMMTGIIFHLLLANEFPPDFHSHLLHTVVPILYILFYFISISNPLETKKFYVILYYPLVYFLIFLLSGPLTGFYPYDFMNVSEHGLGPVLKVTLLFMTPAITVVALVSLYLKNLFESKIKG